MGSFTVETEELDSCPHCDGRRLKTWRKGRDRLHHLSKQELSYSECKGCGLIFLSLRPTENEAYKFYPEEYGPYQAGGSAPTVDASVPQKIGVLKRVAERSLGRFLGVVNYTVARMFPDAFAQRFEDFYRPGARGMKLLDFGCGSDVFLNLAAAQGWDTIGVDFSEATVERVAASGHKALLMSPAMWDKIEDDSLDFVRISHVLEHLYYPQEVLQAIRRKMKPGAIIHISVPNPRSASSRLFGSRWWGLECPRHVMLYSPEVLRRMLRELGFSGMEFLHDVITKDFARSLGYLMYDRGWIPHVEIERMMHRENLSRALYTPARIASLLCVADRFHLFAKK